MLNHPFQVGDQAEFQDDEPYFNLKKGTQVTVTNIFFSHTNHLLIGYKSPKGKGYAFAKQFQKVSPNQKNQDPIPTWIYGSIAFELTIIIGYLTSRIINILQ